ncbi:MAG: selenide, water dikinase SelD [Cyanophyceae cyanobacterium]
MQGTSAITQELVLVGGGHSHSLVLRMWGMNPLPRVRLTLISDGFDTPYSGMLPGHVAGIYSRSECYIDLHPLAQFAGAQFYVDQVVGIDLERRQVLCRDRPPVRFDVLSLDIGSTPKVSAAVAPELTERAIAAKPIGRFLERWQRLQKAVTEASSPQDIAIIGGGVGGVELALAMEHRLQGRAKFHLIHRQQNLLPSHNFWVRRHLRRLLEEREVQLHLGEAAIAHVPNVIKCQSGAALPCDWSIWVTEAGATPWIQQCGLATDGRGFLAVNDKLQSRSHPFVFAAGDVATLTHAPHPKAGVFAVRHGKPLFHNLRAYLQEKPLQIYRPQQRYLSLIGSGDGRAIASRGPLWAWGKWVWRWKDWLDRKFMTQFQDLSPMPSSMADPAAHSKTNGDAPQVPPMFCAGCGSKVGRQTLTRALARLECDRPGAQGNRHSNGSPIPLLESPDDAAIWQPPGDRPLVQTIDYFRSPIADPYRFGQIAANHCLSDLFATGATPHSVLALATIPYGSSKVQEETLYQLLRGIDKILSPLGTALIGGHTTEGPELALGLSCNGLLDQPSPLTKGGLQPGDRLILTKPLGTGTLLAAHGRNRARGQWLEAAIAMMLQSNHVAGAIAQSFNPHACTDITGFGLLGHLIEMVEASSKSLTITLKQSQIPALPGSLACLEQGITSSLQDRNAQLQNQVSPWRSPLSPQQALLVDPQTSGGLLIAAPEQDTMMLLKQLHQAGYKDAAVIGTVSDSSNSQASAPDRPILLKS